MPNELKPCPFCGGKAEIKEWKRSKMVDCSAFSTNPDYCKTKKLPTKYLVKCSNKKCGACRPQTRYFYTKKKATEEWNRRADNGTT